MFIILNFVIVLLIWKSQLSKDKTILQTICTLCYAIFIPWSFFGTIFLLFCVAISYPGKILTSTSSCVNKAGKTLNTKIKDI